MNTANTAYCCGSMGDAAGSNPAGLSTCTHRDCQDERGNSVPCVNNARSRNGDGQSDGPHGRCLRFTSNVQLKR